MFHLTIDDILIEVEPKHIRTLRLTLKRGTWQPHVSCPLFCSEREVIAFVSKHMDWIHAQQAKMRQRAEQQAEERPITPEDAQRFCWRLDRILKEALAETGEKINGYRVKQMRTEWGSCNPHRKTLVFNLAMAHMPDEYIRYVVIHELCHLRQANHSPAFWAEVERYCPNWRDIRRAMRNK